MPKLPQVANSQENQAKMGDFALPESAYLCALTSSEFKENNKKTGHYLLCIFTITEGPKKGSTFRVYLNLANTNPVAVEMANKEFNTICDACGLVDVEDSDELLNIELGVILGIDEGDSNYPPSNTVQAYFPAEDYEEMLEDYFGDSTEEGPEEEEEEVEVEEEPETKEEQKEEEEEGLPWE